MSCECQPIKKRNYYRYYDTPDGCDVFRKILVTSKYGAITGLVLSTYDVLMYSRVVGFGPMMRRYAYHTVPLTLAGATFAVVANSLQHYRNKDDSLNYFIGGLACGPIMAYYFGSYHALLVGGIVLGIAAKIKKDSIDSGRVLFPHPAGNMGRIDSWRNDYTLVPDPRDSKHLKALIREINAKKVFWQIEDFLSNASYMQREILGLTASLTYAFLGNACCTLRFPPPFGEMVLPCQAVGVVCWLLGWCDTFFYIIITVAKEFRVSNVLFSQKLS